MHKYTVCDADGNPEHNLTSSDRLSWSDRKAHTKMGKRIRLGHLVPATPKPDMSEQLASIQYALSAFANGDPLPLTDLLLSLKTN